MGGLGSGPLGAGGRPRRLRLELQLRRHQLRQGQDDRAPDRRPERGLYWRATTLDQFEADRWLESPITVSSGPANGPLPLDPLLPERSQNRRALVRQDVEVVALADEHVVAAAQPVVLEAPQLGNNLVKLSDGSCASSAASSAVSGTRSGAMRHDRTQPHSPGWKPGPAVLDRFLDVGRTRVEPFGTPGRDARVDALFDDERYLALWPYRAVWNEARRLRAGAETPYGAVVAIETWLRSTGGFAYDESPPRPGGSRRSRTSWPRASAATASTSPARWL